MFKGKVVAFALMLVLATSIYAGDVDDCKSLASIWDGPGLPSAGFMVSICPAGDFEWLRDAGNGGSNDYVEITALDASSAGIPGIPWTDYWLNSCNPAKQLCLCASPVVADSLTGANGKTTFGGRIAGGGCTLTQGIWWAIQGKQIKGNKPTCDVPLCLTIIVKSPDYTGAGGNPDCVVNLSDLIPFGSTYNKSVGQPGYNQCMDYNDTNAVNLSDFALFGSHYLHKCF